MRHVRRILRAVRGQTSFARRIIPSAAGLLICSRTWLVLPWSSSATKSVWQDRRYKYPFLIGELRGLGVALREIVVVPDEVDRIAEALRRVSPRNDHVFTSGGVGPTHDDVTMEGIAAAFSVQVVRHPRLEALLRGYYELQKAAALRSQLADGRCSAGRGSCWKDRTCAGRSWDAEHLHLPGIPEIFRKVLAIAETFATPRLCCAKSTCEVKKG